MNVGEAVRASVGVRVAVDVAVGAGVLVRVAVGGRGGVVAGGAAVWVGTNTAVGDGAAGPHAVRMSRKRKNSFFMKGLYPAI